MKISGVYIIQNIVNNKYYIGESVDIKRRLSGHKWELRMQKHHNPHLQAEYNKYGEETFQFDILDTCDSKHTKAMEHYWCNILQAHNRNYGYNLLTTSVDGKFTHSAETVQKLKDRIPNVWSKESREKVSKRMKGKALSKKAYEKAKKYWKDNPMPPQCREAARIANTGRKQSDELIEKRISKIRGRIQSEKERAMKSLRLKGKKRSEEQVQKIRDRAPAVKQLDKYGNLIKEWRSITIAANALNIKKSGISNVLSNNKANTAGGYKWEYVHRRNEKYYKKSLTSNDVY